MRRNSISTKFASNHPRLLVILCFVGIFAAAGPSQGSPTSNQPVLPPALQAAVQSGNATAVNQVIAGLSAGSSGQAIDLADKAVRSAEVMLATRPKEALQVSIAAGMVAHQPLVCGSSISGCQDIAATLARIGINPTAARVDPINAATILQFALEIAVHIANPSLIASMANQASSLAEKVLPDAAPTSCALALQALTSVSTETTWLAAPQMVLNVVVTAARIAISPSAVAANSNATRRIGILAQQILQQQTVYQVSPVAAQAAKVNAMHAAGG